MARLNEPPAPVESIEALKRRFVRQNREIARANSTQSLRIRNLEAETSRLLSENLGLREQIIKLQHEVNGSRSRYFAEDVGTVKAKLEEKLAELGSLVTELGGIGNDGRHNRSPPRKSGRASHKQSPDQKNWKNALTLSEATGGLDGRLPPIVEDKYFPRRTMDAEELLGILSDPANAIDSPDLGPPPVAHFDEGDPIKFDASRKVEEPALDAPEETPQPLFANLETRRKRRESSHSGDLERSQKAEMQDPASL
ncbi:hypothetical protein MMC08_007749 [Hypocenomyce scalaris]|nr:hypothetical protein [Hypocenomyce scalaris]